MIKVIKQQKSFAVMVNDVKYDMRDTREEAEQLAEELRRAVIFLQNGGHTEKPEKCHLCETPLARNWDAFRVNDKNDAKIFHAKIGELVYVCPPCGKKAMMI